MLAQVLHAPGPLPPSQTRPTAVTCPRPPHPGEDLLCLSAGPGWRVSALENPTHYIPRAIARTSPLRITGKSGSPRTSTKLCTPLRGCRGEAPEHPGRGTHTRTHLHACTYTHAHTHTCTCTHPHVYAHAHTNTCTCIRAHTHAHAHTHHLTPHRYLGLDVLGASLLSRKHATSKASSKRS